MQAHRKWMHLTASFQRIKPWDRRQQSRQPWEEKKKKKSEITVRKKRRERKHMWLLLTLLSPHLPFCFFIPLPPFHVPHLEIWPLLSPNLVVHWESKKASIFSIFCRWQPASNLLLCFFYFSTEINQFRLLVFLSFIYFLSCALWLRQFFRRASWESDEMFAVITRHVCLFGVRFKKNTAEMVEFKNPVHRMDCGGCVKVRLQVRAIVPHTAGLSHVTHMRSVDSLKIAHWINQKW